MTQTSVFRKSLLLLVMTGFCLFASAQRYEIDRGHVYFGHALLKYADARTFRDLGCGYAKDKYNVYMDGRVLENVDPSSFRLKEPSSWRNQGRNEELPPSHRGYYKTKFNVYYGNKKLDAHAQSFEELGGGYAKDSFTVFYYGQKVDGAMALTFKYTGDGYGEDSYDVFYKGKKIE